MKTEFIEYLESMHSKPFTILSKKADVNNFAKVHSYYSVIISKEVFKNINRYFRSYKLKAYIKSEIDYVFDFVIPDNGKDVLYQFSYDINKPFYNVCYTDKFYEPALLFAVGKEKGISKIKINKNTITYYYYVQMFTQRHSCPGLTIVTKEQYIKDLFSKLIDMKSGEKIAYEKMLFSKNNIGDITWETI